MLTRNQPERSIWVITTRRRGDIVQCEAVARALSDTVRFIAVNPRNPWAYTMPWGPMDPQESYLISFPFPDLIVAANRRTYPYVRFAHRQSQGRTKVVYLKPPGRSVAKFAALWAPAHDRLKGRHIISTITAPHLVSAQTLSACRRDPLAEIATLPGPRLGLILGGDTKRVTYDAAAIRRVTDTMKRATNFRSLLVAASRRTPPALLDAVRKQSPFAHCFISNGTQAHFYFHILAHADALIVTGDSHNMVGEALAVGVGVHVIEPPNNPQKFNWTISVLRNQGLIQARNAPISPSRQTPFDETPEITEKIRTLLA